MKLCPSFILVLMFSFTVAGCREKKAPEIPFSEYDFPQIQEKGEINVLTLSGSMSYFIYKGEPRGYEYELLNDFAESNNLKVNIKLAENETKLMEMLLKGEGDLIACNIPITNEGKEYLFYCGREVINHQVAVQQENKIRALSRDVTELIGKDVWVIHDSKYYKRLKNLNDEIGGGIHIRIIEKDTVSVEDLIEMVAKGEIAYTVSDVDMAKLNKTYFRNINISLPLSHPQRSSWAVRKTSFQLASAINEWFAANKNTPRYQSIVKRYFEMSKMPEPIAVTPVWGPGQISPFDILFKRYAKEIDWDWRLLVSISYQESKFYTDRVSWAGAAGLMGLMPKTAEAFGLPVELIEDPEENIKAAAAYIKRLNRSFSSVLNEYDRIKFILGAYNAGIGHIYDAQALAEKNGKDPYLWEDNVEEYLRLKSLPEYYNDSVCKSGYLRGVETFNYIRSVIARWEYYQEQIVM
jgi:membrane-bound lytic murein transglycosylase F